jgi:hypothetical protein
LYHVGTQSPSPRAVIGIDVMEAVYVFRQFRQADTELIYLKYTESIYVVFPIYLHNNAPVGEKSGIVDEKCG